MPRTSERGGPRTRARIAAVAAGLFLEHGFDEVTVADVAREAGVSSVTVFKHFPRKEDLFLDRSAEAADLLRAAVRDSPDVLASLRSATLALLDERHPLTGVDDRQVAFFRTVAGSPALLARSRAIAYDLQRTLAEELRRPDADLFAALFVAGYGAVLVETARQVVAGAAPADLVADARTRFEHLFTTLRNGLSL